MATLAKMVTKTLDVGVSNTTIDLSATIKSFDVLDTKFIFGITSNQGLAINLSGATVKYIVEYYVEGKSYAIEGNCLVVDINTISFNLPDQLRGYKGKALIGIYATLTDGTKIDIKDIIVRVEPSIMDKNIDFSAKAYFKDFESIKAEVILEGEKAKTNINAVVSDVQSVGDAAKEDIKATLPSIQSQLSELKEDLGMLITVTEASANMFDKTKVSADKRIEKTGVETSVTGAFITDFIPVEQNTKYTWLSNSGWLGSANAQRVVGYSENKTYIDYYEVSTTESGGAMHIDTSNYSSAVKYIRVNGRMNTIESFMFVKGEVYPSTYIPYYEEQKTISKEIEKNPLYGKKIALNGDSICYGAGSTGGFGKIIAEENGMSISNIAVSGGTIAYSSGRHCISRTITNMPSDADYYIIEGGVNDWSIDLPIGNVTDTYPDTFDDTTMCGALESICKTLQLNFKGKKYGFIFPHNVGGYKQGWTTTFRPKMKECLKKWGIPYLDLSEECVQLRNRDELRIYTANGDGWHPTEEGYRLFYVPKIEAWLKTL